MDFVIFIIFVLLVWLFWLERRFTKLCEKIDKDKEELEEIRVNIIKILEKRNMLIKDSLRNIILEIEEMQKQTPTDRTRPISDDLYNKWLFDEEEQ